MGFFLHYRFGWLIFGGAYFRNFILSSLNLRVKTQQYFISLSDIFLDKKTLLEIWLNPGLNLTIFWGTGLCSFGVPSPQTWFSF